MYMYIDLIIRLYMFTVVVVYVVVVDVCYGSRGLQCVINNKEMC